MKLNQMIKTVSKSKKRVGRGYGSGKGGHTTFKGQKGQRTRSKIGLLFEGTKIRKSLIKRLPMKRGKEKFKPSRKKPLIVNVKYLNLLKNGSEVTIESLIKNGLVVKEARNFGVKILGEGKLEKKLIVKVLVSKGARKKIIKAGGEIIEIKKQEPKLKPQNLKKKPVKAKAKPKKQEKKNASTKK